MITGERWRQIDRVFQAALEREPFERMSFLEKACAGDETLRKEVEALISCDDQQGLLIDAPAFEVAASLFTPNQPELEAGQQVSHYRILNLLGTGGMGEVYLAQDTKLGRKIALKLLPADFTVDETRVQRFQQEARAASALNHPNIITIHEIGEYEGRNFIATEFIAGETLRHRIKRAETSLRDVLDIAIQVVSALQAAHHAGIIHRDIKPENIMRRPDGYVKVLDFGLAKLTSGQSPINDPEASTIDKISTTPGLVIGTVNYMSPEQARGLNLDARSDLFSLGVVVYEMVTGHAPFEGDTPSDLIASILKVDPAPLARYSPDLPIELQLVISKALVKDREKRYQSADELLVDLRTLKQEMDLHSKLQRSAPSTSSGQLPITASGSQLAIETAIEAGLSTGDAAAIRTASSAEYIVGQIKRHKWSAALILAAIIVAITGIVYALYRSVGKAAPKTNVKLARLTTTGNAYGAAISPDGKYVAYLMGANIWIKQVATSSDVQIVSPSGAGRWELIFSPDGNYLYYSAREKGDSETTLYQIPALGGPPRKLISGVDSRVTFSPDGERLAFVRNYPSGESALTVANIDGSEERTLTAHDYSNQFVSVAWSPDGKKIACSSLQRDDRGSYFGVIEVPLQDAVAEKPITVQRWGWVDQLAWLKDGSGLVMVASSSKDVERQVWLLSYPGAEAHRITADFNAYDGVSLAAESDSLVTTRSEGAVNIWVVPNGDPNGAKQVTSGVGKKDGLSGIAWTPDGKIVYCSYTRSQEVWIMDSDGSNQEQLTFQSGQFGYGISVSPDGRYIVFASKRAGDSNIWRVNSDGTNLTRLTSGGGSNPFCSPDGQWVIYYTVRSDAERIAWKVPIEGGNPVQLTGLSSNILGISPDGRLIAYGASQLGAKRIGIISRVNNQSIKMIDLPQTAMPRRMQWAPDGRAVTYTDGSNIWSQPLDGGPPKELTDFKSDGTSSFAWSRDGKQLACMRGTGTSDVVLISDVK